MEVSWYFLILPAVATTKKSRSPIAATASRRLRRLREDRFEALFLALVPWSSKVVGIAAPVKSQRVECEAQSCHWTTNAIALHS